MDSNQVNLRPIRVNGTLPEQAYDYLKELIANGTYLAGQRLPSENEVARSLNISRTSLREALNRLEIEGYIARKRGLGTFVIGANPFQVEDGIERLYSDTEIITSRGYSVSTAETQIISSEADKEIADRLQIPERAPVTIIDRLRLADKKPFCWDSNIFPAKYLPPNTDENSIGPSLFRFTNEKLGLQISHAVTYLSPVLSDAFLSRKLEIPEHSPMMLWVQVHYTKDYIPVWFSRIWYPEHVARWHIVRTR